TSSKTSLRLSSSSLSRGAPASPSSQQPPLHFRRSQTNCCSTILSLISTLSMAITRECLFGKYNSFRGLPFERIDEMGQIDRQEIVDDSERVFVGRRVEI